MATKTGYLKEYASQDTIIPKTSTAAVYDPAKEQALSATLVDTPLKDTLGYPSFSTVTAYSEGDIVYYANKLYKCKAGGHAAGAWADADFEETDIKTEIAIATDADDTPTENSTKLVKSGGVKNAIDTAVEAVEEQANEQYAKKDGYYSQMTAGSAENLVGQTVDSEAYLIRPTGGTENEVANGIAYVEGMEGNSAVWNQLVGSDTTSVTLMSGRKYYTKIDGTAAVVSGAGSAVSVTGGVDMVIDLTLLGIDNLTTTAKVEEWLAQHVGTKPYYAYNAGTILSAQTLGIKTYGQNLLNPTTKQAKLIPYTWVEGSTNNSNKYTIKNIPSGATATFTPDNTGVAESVTITDNKFDITDYGSGVLELSAATADTYVCMKWDGKKDDEVVPYEDPHTYNFDVRNVYGKVSGEGEYVQCFPNGMGSAGSVCNTLTVSEAVVKMSAVDLGSLNYSYQTYLQAVSALIPGSKAYGVGTYGNIISDRYTNATYNTITLHDKVVVKGNSVFVRDSNITASDINSSGKVAKLNGAMFNYELATPITYTDLIYRDGGIDTPLADVLMNITVNNWSMEEQLLTPYVDGNPTSIPATISTKYGMDAVEQIDTLNKTCYFADDIKDNLQALLNCVNTNCSETLGGTFSIGDPTQEDSKVFPFTFTPNVEPTNELGE